MRIAVLMGGTSAERQVSLASGKGIVKGLRAAGHAATAIDAATGEVLSDARLEEMAQITATPPAEMRGSRRALSTCPALLEADLAFIIVHGGEGEDGTLQAFLEIMDIPYTGSDMRTCALTWDKEVTRRLLAEGGVPVAEGVYLPPRPAAALNDTAAIHDRVMAACGYPVIVKPPMQGSTIGISKVDDRAGLAPAVAAAAQFGGGVLIERFIPGHELTVAVLDGEAFPVTEIEADTGFYDYERKYQKGHTRYVTPAEIPAESAAEARRLAERAYEIFGCRGVARVDFRLQPDGALYCLEINTVPGMTETSLVPKGAAAVGLDYATLVDRMAKSALAGRAAAGGPAAR